MFDWVLNTPLGFSGNIVENVMKMVLTYVSLNLTFNSVRIFLELFTQFET